METEIVQEGEIVSVHDVVMQNGAKWPMKTIIYERNGEQYRGCKTHDDLYYFGGGGDLRFSPNVHEAWERAFK